MRVRFSARGALIWVARASRVQMQVRLGLSASRRDSLSLCSVWSVSNAPRKVRDREDAFASTRDARATHAARSERQWLW